MGLKETIEKSLTRLFASVNPGETDDYWYIPKEFATPSFSGVKVDHHSALYSTAVYACVRVLAETVASLPLFLYRRLSNGGKELAADHPLQNILHLYPNSEMSSFIWREAAMGHLCLRGNAYSQIVHNQAGQVIELWPLRPDWVEPKREKRGGEITYEVTIPGSEKRTLPATQVLHIPGLSFDGRVGYSPISLAREAVGLALGAEEFGARFFANGAHIAGVLEHPGIMGDVAYNRLKETLKEEHGGLTKAHKIKILEEGTKWAKIGVAPNEAQFLETRRFQTHEIARIFRVPPHLIGDLSNATFSNIEHQSLDFSIHTIRPWLVRWEQCMNIKLLTPQERETYFIEFKMDGLLRGDIRSRYLAYAVGRQWGWLSANEIRGLENMNPREGGDTYLTPLNMEPVGGEGYEQKEAGALRLLRELIKGDDNGRNGNIRSVTAP